jgi:NAD(P)-dependent dehydrogenase (short-subunit alcohol dehydrogenase family)
MAEWTAADLPRQDGRSFVVTGANSGIGAEAARMLAAAGATVVLACRDQTKAHRAAATMTGDVRLAALDLADLRSVREFPAQLNTALGGRERIDVLINNAGVMATPFAKTADGFELQVGTNHLGHFALTGLLLDRIDERVVTIASPAHRIGRIDIADLNWEHRRYKRWAAYGQAKLANVMFTLDLHRRLAASGSAVRSVAAHPGYADTHLQGHTGTWLDPLQRFGNGVIAQSAQMGALPTLFAATHPDALSGTFWGPRYGLRGYPAPSRPTPRASDEALAAQLWALSEKLTAVSYL